MRNITLPNALGLSPVEDRRHTYADVMTPEEYRLARPADAEPIIGNGATPVKLIAVEVTKFEEPTLKAVTRQSHQVIPNRVRAEPCTAEEVAAFAVELLRMAAASGFVVTIDNVGQPKLGMGGYQPHVQVRPDYPTVRKTMDENTRRAQAKHIVEFGQNEFPLNLYGDVANYKIYPNIGEDESK